MKDIYFKIWKLAKPYYKKGRPMDIDHIRWMIKEAEIVCGQEKIDKSLLLPLVILHEVGYGVGKHVYLNKKLKKTHMIEGAKIAAKILNKVKYSKDKTKKICYFISVHDNWIYGEYSSYKKDKVLRVFNDLDFIWMASPKGFSAVRKALGKSKKEIISYIKHDDKHKNLPLCTKTTKTLYLNYLKNQKCFGTKKEIF